MKQIMVVITEKNRTKAEVYSFTDKNDAREFIKEKYLALIRSVDQYDFENSYINKKFDFAQVSSYSNVYQISLCSNVIEVSKRKKKSR